MDPLQNTWVIFNQITGLPNQVRQLWRKPGSVLAGARTDLQEMGFALQQRCQQIKNRRLVVLAGLGERFVPKNNYCS